MTQNKHTPGPWTYCRNTDCGPCGNIYGGEKTYVGQAFGPLHGELYKSQGNPLRFCDADEQFANARLMCASPDLLAAAEALDEWDETHSKARTYTAEEHHELARRLDEVVEIARAAIAKARGQS